MQNACFEKLKENNLKLTPKRRAIIDYFDQEGRFLTPENVWENVRKRFKRLGLPSVYRNLDQFEKCGILTKVLRPNRRLHYALSQSNNKDKHTFVCIKCGKVEEISTEVDLNNGHIKEYKVLNHSLQVEGLCPKCQ